MPETTRETRPDGSLQLAVGKATFAYRRLRPGALLVTITGIDEGQFGTAALDEIRMEMLRHRPLELFIDTRAAIAVTGTVPQEWTQFFALNREHLKRVSVLVGNKAIELSVAIAQHLSQTGNLIQIYTDAELFAARVAAARAAPPM